MKSINERIKQRREELKMSQEELAQKLGYSSRSTIAKIESGKNDIPRKKLDTLANALNTSTFYLLGIDESEDTINKLKEDIKLIRNKVEIEYDVIARFIQYSGYEPLYPVTSDGKLEKVIFKKDNKEIIVNYSDYKSFVDSSQSYLEYSFNKLINNHTQYTITTTLDD